jgi:hypothetical protein
MSRPTLESALRILLPRRNHADPATRATTRALIGRTLKELRK